MKPEAQAKVVFCFGGLTNRPSLALQASLRWSMWSSVVDTGQADPPFLLNGAAAHHLTTPYRGRHPLSGIWHPPSRIYSPAGLLYFDMAFSSPLRSQNSKQSHAESMMAGRASS